MAATILAYQPAWRAGFVWDDDLYVTHNRLLTAPDGLRRIWFSLESPSQYFPLVYTTFRFERALWGLQPAGYHWVNILLQAANALLVWRLLARLRLPGAWLAAAIFALHPVQVESVAWITERKNVLWLFFLLLALRAWVDLPGSRQNAAWTLLRAGADLLRAGAVQQDHGLHTACGAAADLVAERKADRPAADGEVVPFLAMGAGMGVVTMWWERYHQGTKATFFAMGLVERILIASHAVWFYRAIGLAGQPDFQLSALDHRPGTRWPTAGCWRGRRGWRDRFGYARRFAGRGVEVARCYMSSR